MPLPVQGPPLLLLDQPYLCVVGEPLFSCLQGQTDLAIDILCLQRRLARLGAHRSLQADGGLQLEVGDCLHRTLARTSTGSDVLGLRVLRTASCQPGNETRRRGLLRRPTSLVLLARSSWPPDATELLLPADVGQRPRFLGAHLRAVSAGPVPRNCIFQRSRLLIRVSEVVIRRWHGPVLEWSQAPRVPVGLCGKIGVCCLRVAENGGVGLEGGLAQGVSELRRRTPVLVVSHAGGCVEVGVGLGQVPVAGEGLLDLRIALRFQVVEVVGRAADGFTQTVLDALVQVVAARSEIADSAVHVPRWQVEAALEVWRQELR